MRRADSDPWPETQMTERTLTDCFPSSPYEGSLNDLSTLTFSILDGGTKKRKRKVVESRTQLDKWHLRRELRKESVQKALLCTVGGKKGGQCGQRVNSRIRGFRKKGSDTTRENTTTIVLGKKKNRLDWSAKGCDQKERKWDKLDCIGN